MTKRVHNFSSGPAVLPLSVLEELQRDLVCLPGVGCSALEVTHRGEWFEGILAECEANLRKLLAIPEGYSVFFAQGGSRLQFAMLPMNLLGGGKADYLVTGSWSKMALEEAGVVGQAAAACDGESHNYSRLPRADEIRLSDNPAYVYFCSNETIQGVQFANEPASGSAPLICDASSDFLHRPLDVSKYGMIYACAQKNAGPSGVTIVVIRDELLNRSPSNLPTMLSYPAYVKNGSMPNTPPVFSIYVTTLVTRWLLGSEVGSLAKIHERNRQKAKLLYDVLDASEGFYQGHAQADARSLMNVTFRMEASLEKQFLKQAEERGLYNLKGHRSVGGVRASIYNAMPVASVEALRDFMLEFQKASR